VKGIIYHGQHDFRVEEVADPAIQHPHDAIVRVEETAICGSDLHLWHGESLPVDGFAMGHEFGGIVEDVGSAVAHFRKGDRVVVSCTAGCGHCSFCSRKLYGGCTTLAPAGPYTNVFGNPLLPGGQAEGVRVPWADINLFRVPESLGLEQALFVTDILPTGTMGAELAEVGFGDVVVVFGCGPVGTFAQRASQIRGAAAVVAVDLHEGRLARAKERGCIPVNPSREDLKERVLELTHGEGADAAVEAVGVPALVRDAIDVVRHGGRVSVVGVIPADEVPLPIMSGVMAKNMTLRAGLVTPQNHVQSLLPLIEQGRLDPTEIITHRMPLCDGVKGYEVFAAREEDVLKVVLTP
jgi:threonine dehydrogenase-like Zn-dependent dehydrogenase